MGDREHLEFTALHRPGKHPSKAFLDSVIYCDKAAIPELTEADRARMITIQPRADEIVPLDMMVIECVNTKSVPINGHMAGIALAAVCLPRYL